MLLSSLLNHIKGTLKDRKLLYFKIPNRLHFSLQVLIFIWNDELFYRYFFISGKTYIHQCASDFFLLFNYYVWSNSHDSSVSVDLVIPEDSHVFPSTIDWVWCSYQEAGEMIFIVCTANIILSYHDYLCIRLMSAKACRDEIIYRFVKSVTEGG